MKTAAVAFALAAAAGSVSAASAGHRHHNHRHVHQKRATEVVTVPGPTVVAYELDGQQIPKEEACDGIDSGELVWADGETHPNACAPQPTPSESLEEVGGAFYEQAPTALPSSSSSAPPPPPPPKSSSAPPPPPPEPSPKSPSYGGGKGVDSEFPDGELSCSEFPSDYGAISLDYLGFGGWSGIQYVSGFSGNAYSNIRTAVEGDGCEDGAMCSYACPPGYQKAQWPEHQGSTGQSIGGLKCEGGKLYLTNTKLSKKLCIKGIDGIEVKNTLGKLVSVCRTDYPGTEAETVPLPCDPGSTNPLTCPKGDDYFHWGGKPTSAQYYVNPAGVGIEKACRWGDGGNTGNWAPVNLGAGYSAGAAWLSIFQNAPTNVDGVLDFIIRIVGPDLSEECYYENGVYYQGSTPNNKGCTASSPSGQATFVFE